MNNKTNPYHVVDFPPERRGMAAFLELKAGKHCMYALLEVDVTVARKFIEDYKVKTGEQLSFTGYLISCLARAVDEDKAVQAYRKGSKQLVVFDDVSGLFKALFRMSLRRDPTIVTSMAGTVGISSVGMFGKGHAGWGISTGSHVLDLVVGGTSRQLAEVDGRIEPREILSLTIIFDHDIIDGAPAARFTRRLVELIESGYGLDNEDTRHLL
ncbi:MAG TPA: 2-oxo acid dehydrogenase subunit E2 [Anaerolineales bacterium]